MLKLAVMFGGKSTEHKISMISGTSVISNLNKKKYEIYPIYIDENGNFYKYTKNIEEIKVLKINEEITELEPIANIFEYLKDIDIIFPVLHGLYGEDGSIQGMFELIGKKYVGCKILSSSLCMDKVYTKILFKTCGIETAKSMYIKKSNNQYIYIDDNFDRKILSDTQLETKVKDYLNYPVFIKPSRSGSSVGVSKVNTKEELIKNLEEAFLYDDKVLIEESIVGREVECAILGTENLIASPLGEVLSSDEFYSYDSKYKNNETRTVIPAEIEKELEEKVMKTAMKAYLACDCKCLSRVDFFIEKDTNRIILNEINTLPGFTEISMYPKLIEQMGYKYSEILDKLIELAE